jgi:Zn-dependent metalloprotease
MTSSMCRCFCSIVPPYLLKELGAKSDDPQVRQAVAETRATDRKLRAVRASLLGNTLMKGLAPEAAPLKRRVFDCQHTNDTARRQVLEEGGRLPSDIAVKEAYAAAGTTWKFYHDLFDRSSVDNAGLTLVSSVHYRRDYNNAVWDGHQMVYGDGDGIVFERFTKSIDIIGHELTHGVTQFTAGLDYSNQPGALNEHFSDVFGILVKQWSRRQRDPSRASWIIGEGLLKPTIHGVGLRSMSAPGTAYDDRVSGLGKDPQPSHMRDYVKLPDTEDGDYGGVHYNSGIPNVAFYRAAVAIGKPAWEVVGKIWYVTLTQRLRADSNFSKCALETISVARDYFDNDTAEKVSAAWVSVGVITAGIGPMASLSRGNIRRLSAASKKAAASPKHPPTRRKRAA